MTELTTLKNDELQEINGGIGFWAGFAVCYVAGKIVDYAGTEMMDPNHYLGKPSYQTW